MVTASIPPSPTKKIVGRVLQNIDLKWTHFQGKEILIKNDLKLRLTFTQKVRRKRAMCSYEI